MDEFHEKYLAEAIVHWEYEASQGRDDLDLVDDITGFSHVPQVLVERDWLIRLLHAFHSHMMEHRVFTTRVARGEQVDVLEGTDQFNARHRAVTADLTSG